MREHDSHSFAALAGWSYVPSEVERAVWSVTPKKPGYEKYEPWTDRKNDIGRPGPQAAIHDAEWKRKRRRFKEIWGEPLTDEEKE